MFDNIPHEMRAYKSWVLWCYEESASGKPTKVPYSATGHNASPTDSSTWASYEVVTRIHAANSDKYSGIGFVLSDRDPYGFIDLDEPKNPDGSALSSEEFNKRMDRQRFIHESFDSYSELSPSGNGLHIIIKGTVPNGRKRSSVEVYSDQRFMTMTGNVYKNSEIKDRNELLNELWAEMGKGQNAQMFYAGLAQANLSDESVLEMARTASNAEKFSDLFDHANWQKYYPSQSEADFALMDILAFYSQNAAQTQKLFLQSGLAQRVKSRAQYRLNYMLNRCFDKMLPPVDFEGLRDQVNAAIQASQKVATVSTQKAYEVNDGKDYLNLGEPVELVDKPSFIYNPPAGLLGDIARYIYAQSPRPVPEISLAGAIGLMSGICGKAFNISGTGLNQYTLLLAATGCHAKDTEILMYDGSIKLVQDIQVGDVLMGPDSKPRNVLNLARGREKMVSVTPTKGKSFVVNENHILSLIHTQTKKRIFITPKLWFQQHNTFKHCYKLERVGVEFSDCKRLPLDPWFLGALLGDGHFSGKVALTGMDEVVHHRALVAASWFGVEGVRHQIEGNKSWQITFSKKEHKNHAGVPNKLQTVIRDLGLMNKGAADKFIPQIYKTSSRANRLAILAGLIDTDGSLTCGGYDFISKSKQLSEDVVFVARSLGFAAYICESEKYSQNGTGGIYHRVSISGDTTELPLSLEYKKAQPRQQKKNVLVTGLNMTMLKEDDFYGFALSDDHLYLTGDFTIHHNTGKEGANAGISRLMSKVKELVPPANDFIGPSDISSQQALIKALSDNPSLISIVGEFGLYLKEMGADNASPHMIGLKKMLLKLYNVSGEGDKLGGMAYSDREKNIASVEAPAFSIFGETAPEPFYEALTENMISGGLLPRFTVIEYHGDRVPRNKSASTVVPSPELIQNVGTLCATAFGLINQKKVIHVQMTAEAEVMFDDLDALADRSVKGAMELRRQLWTRVHLKSLRLAALAAVGCNPFDPTIDKESAKWAIDIVMADIKNMLSRFESGDVGLNNEESKQTKILTKLIKKFVTSTWDEIKKVAGESSQKLHAERIIPYGWLQRNTSTAPAFKNDRQGATSALKRALKTLEERGEIQAMTRSVLVQKFGTGAQAYAITQPGAFGL